MIASATIPSLYTTSIEAIGNSLTLSANQKIEMIVSDIEGLDTRITATEGQIELLATKSEVEEVQEDADFATPLHLRHSARHRASRWKTMDRRRANAECLEKVAWSRYNDRQGISGNV